MALDLTQVDVLLRMLRFLCKSRNIRLQLSYLELIHFLFDGHFLKIILADILLTARVFLCPAGAYPYNCLLSSTWPLSSLIHKVSSFVFSHFNNLSPAPLCSLLYLNLGYHDYLTRSRFDIHELSFFALRCQAPIIWNNIPLTVRESVTVTDFKRQLKSYFSESSEESNSA